MLNDSDLWDTAMGYVKRARTMPDFEKEIALMTVGAQLLCAFELRRIANAIHDAVEVRP